MGSVFILKEVDMSSASIAKRALYDFTDFTATTPTEDLHLDDPPCLADYVCDWVRSGRGVRACRGDFTTFMIALPAIIDEWLKHESSLNYVKENHESDECEIVERRVSSIFGRLNSYGHHVLDPDFFAMCTFTELHGRKAGEPQLH
ncbi:hypothetical protein ACI2L1_23020 [Streptomyces sp. NPDC019531]|uniref:hypothetical protein n=1 Tax=Streptomyces sp. NPDC019531 TaxID=3365062 RepID=UPI00384DD37D